MRVSWGTHVVALLILWRLQTAADDALLQPLASGHLGHRSQSDDRAAGNAPVSGAWIAIESLTGSAVLWAAATCRSRGSTVGCNEQSGVRAGVID